MVSIAAFILILTVKAALVENPIPLDMAENSVDDQYEGCREKMADLVNRKFLDAELKMSPTFRNAWAEGQNNTKTPEDGLTKNHSVAIAVYTNLKVYRNFNIAARNGKKNYTDMTYRWYSLHFLLTDAIQILKNTQKDCKSTYRGTNVTFNVMKKEIRFGSFASSSLDRSVAEGFGKKSCFEIHTCYSADLIKYSVFPEQKEVLIPPYEKFEVTAVKEHDWCETVYKLNSIGKRSDLNCAVASVNYQIYK